MSRYLIFGSLVEQWIGHLLFSGYCSVILAVNWFMLLLERGRNIRRKRFAWLVDVREVGIMCRFVPAGLPTETHLVIRRCFSANEAALDDDRRHCCVVYSSIMHLERSKAESITASPNGYILEQQTVASRGLLNGS